MSFPSVESSAMDMRSMDTSHILHDLAPNSYPEPLCKRDVSLNSARSHRLINKYRFKTATSARKFPVAHPLDVPQGSSDSVQGSIDLAPYSSNDSVCTAKSNLLEGDGNNKPQDFKHIALVTEQSSPSYNQVNGCGVLDTLFL
eukprot:CAMPEP_0171299398 /NCGR_PEP_ID=MMETSP0816-20121228/8216_1 /TAXON_ID=420281 /ORGANISM="Proboscia inermis, Strain CCAP1064/1" /LENGTH=142 /DNA_ID=CAMNT_0011775165 /DNA_START=8 /DNA_END=436 /DNA_ORIENTATION=+